MKLLQSLVLVIITFTALGCKNKKSEIASENVLEEKLKLKKEKK